MEISEFLEKYGQLKERGELIRDFYLQHAIVGDKDLRRDLLRGYLGLAVCGSNGWGYDALEKRFYYLDPFAKRIDFNPNKGDFIVFEKKGAYGPSESDPEEDMEWGVYELQPIGDEGIVEAKRVIFKSRLNDILRDSFEEEISVLDKKVEKLRRIGWLKNLHRD